jgi:hypothetical protein
LTSPFFWYGLSPRPARGRAGEIDSVVDNDRLEVSLSTLERFGYSR